MSDPLVESARGEAELGRQLGTLAFAGVAPAAGTTLQAAVWWNGLLRLGLAAPLVAVHDLGLLLARHRGAVVLDPHEAPPPRLHGADATTIARYRTLLRAVAASQARGELEGAVALRDEVIVILLARLFGDLPRRWGAAARTAELLPALPLHSPLYARPAEELRRAHPAEGALAFLRLLGDEHGTLLVRLEQTDLGAFRLFGLAAPAALPELPELFQLANTIGAGQIADFSLQLLPSLLETKRAAAVQTFAVGGYASVERRGSVDALLPGELAHDPEIFAQRALGSELLYYGHERPEEGARRVHGILIDASASMRGAREVFARGLGLALAKKLGLLGGEVWLSFFDSRLHRRVEATALGGRELPYLLCFRSEQGRNYGRVFTELHDELAHGRRRGGPGREVAIVFITHGECHIPLPVVQAIRREAALYGIFVLPSRPLELEYLSSLAGHQVVTAESMAAPAEKRRRALELVEEVVAARPSGPATISPHGLKESRPAADTERT